MKEEVCDIFDKLKEADAICITTNGCVTKECLAIMGKGIAFQAKKRFPATPYCLGRNIMNHGHVVQTFYREDDTHIVSFPTKPGTIKNEGNLDMVMDYYKKWYKDAKEIPGWVCKSSIELIEESAKQLMQLADRERWKVIYLPRPGCSNGGLDWDDVKPVIEPLLDDRVIVCTNER